MPGKTRIKVCGITREADAKALDALHVDYLGFNFHPGSKRFIRPAAAAAIIKGLHHAEAVGIFVDHAPGEIAHIAAQTGIRATQLHGSEGWDTVERIALPVIKAIPHTRLSDWGGLRPEWNRRSGKLRHFLVDTGTADAFGGTGATFDWNLLNEIDLPLPFFLAGGLGPENLAAAVAACRPFAVDLNSGVETVPGIKDVEAVKRCMKILDAGGVGRDE